MAEEIRFTEEEVTNIQNIKNQLVAAFQRLGELDIRRKQIEDARNQLLDEYNQIREQEKQVFTKLNEKYGDGNYNPETNVFTPIVQNEPQTAETEAK